MQRVFVALTVLSVFVLTAGSALAGGIDHKTNFSAEYARTMNRNAAIDYADAVVYNPAGTAFMADGLYLNGSLQYLDKSYTNTVAGTDYTSDTPSYIPSFFALYKRDNWSTYLGFSNYGGGGKVEYDDGNATTLQYAALIMQSPAITGLISHSMEAESKYPGFTLGGAYAFNDMFSASLGVRYIMAEKSAKANFRFSTVGLPTIPDPYDMLIDYEDTASGTGAILGLHYKPSDKFDIAVRYETNTALEFETSVNRDDTGILTDGAKYNRDLPPLLGLGVAYQINKKMRTEINYTWYMNTQADWGGAEDLVDDGFDAGIAFEYDLTDSWLLSIGYLYTESGISADDTEWSAPRLDANTVGGGAAWKVNDRFDVNFGLSYISYYDDTTSSSTFPPNVGLDSDVIIVAAGVQYRFL